MRKITAGRDVLGKFAPKFAQLNDDVLFGEVWSRESELSARDRSLITVTALMAQGLTDTSFGHHLAMAKENGITRSEIAEILTHAAFYAGWPKAWAAFRMAKDIWADAENTDEKQLHQNSMVFPIGAPNDGFAQNVWGIDPAGNSELKLAQAGVEALAAFIKEIGMPTTFAELGIPADTDLKAVADSTVLTGGCCKKLSREELLDILNECK